MEATLTLHQAGHQLGVEDTTLSRLIRVGGLPEARKVNGPEGVVWVIPAEDLPTIASRNGWTIELRDDGTANLKTGEPEGASAEADDLPSDNPDVETADLDDPTDPSGDFGMLPISVGTSPVLVPEDSDSAIEVSLTDTTPVPNQPQTAADYDAAIEAAGEALPSLMEALDLSLLEKLLSAQEGRVTAEVRAQEAKHALAALNVNHNRATSELEIERRERMMASDRHREERMARAVADAKVAELRDRIAREMSLAEAEKQARTEALARSIRAERDAANAVASMGWRARRRYRKLNAPTDK